MLRLARGLRRTATGASVAFSDGQGTYLVAMLLLGAAALFLHRAMMPDRKYRAALEKLIVAEQEPYRGETHQVLSAGVLLGPPWDPCGESERDLRDSLTTIANDFKTKLNAAIARRGEHHLHKCEHREGGCPTPTPDLGDAWTNDDTESTVIVPSTLGKTVADSPAARSVLTASQVLEKLPAYGIHYKSESALQATYFIDLLGDLRYVPRWPDHRIIPAHRSFDGASYVYDALSNAAMEKCGNTTFVKTRPYVDLTGRGVVHTLCDRITSSERPARVLGTLCFDVSPPLRYVKAGLEAASALFDLHLARRPVPRTGETTRFEPCEMFKEGCPAFLQQLSPPELTLLEIQWRSPDTSDAAGASAIRMLAGEEYFGTTIAKDGETEYVLFGRHARAAEADIGTTIMMALFVVLACLLVAVGVERKARRLDVTLIRGLPVGVVEVDETDKIIAANDRAEEIFGLQLPRFGHPYLDDDASVRDQVWFVNQIEDDGVVFLDDAGRLPGGAIRFSPYQEIKAQRSAGYTGSYYAFARKTGQWIRVTGSTMLNPLKEHHTFGMIDTYIDEEHLERLIAARAARRSVS